jgi:HK97 family phage major capsid protein
MTLAEMRARRAELLAQMRAMIDAAAADKRTDLNAEETVAYDAAKAEVEGITRHIERVEGLGQLETTLGERRPAAARSQGTEPIRAGGDPALKEFASIGEFIHAAAHNRTDPRLISALDVMERSGRDLRGEQRMDTGAAGGFMIPPQFRSELMRVDPVASLVRSRAQVIPAGSPPDSAITIPALDQTGNTPENVFGGVEVIWTGEGAEISDTSAVLREIKLEPEEVSGSVTITDKLLRNWEASGIFIENLLRGAINQAEDRAFIFGDGVAKPLGFQNSGAALAFNRGVANKVEYNDLINMAALILERGGTPTWSASQGVKFQVLNMLDSFNRPIYTASPVAGTPDTILGYPVVWNNRLPGVGSKGDLSMVDLSYYLIKDGSGPFVAVSEHVKFQQNKTVIKIWWNVDGQPWLTEPFVEENGYQVSPFVILDVPA